MSLITDHLKEALDQLNKIEPRHLMSPYETMAMDKARGHINSALRGLGEPDQEDSLTRAIRVLKREGL